MNADNPLVPIVDIAEENGVMPSQHYIHKLTRLFRPRFQDGPGRVDGGWNEQVSWRR